MLNDRDDDKFAAQEESEYHFSDDDVSYEVETEAPKAVKEPELKQNILTRLTRSKRMIISGVVFLILVFVAYKMVTPTATVNPSQQMAITAVPAMSQQNPTVTNRAAVSSSENRGTAVPAATTQAPMTAQAPTTNAAPATVATPTTNSNVIAVQQPTPTTVVTQAPQETIQTTTTTTPGATTAPTTTTATTNNSPPAWPGQTQQQMAATQQAINNETISGTPQLPAATEPPVSQQIGAPTFNQAQPMAQQPVTQPTQQNVMQPQQQVAQQPQMPTQAQVTPTVPQSTMPTVQPVVTSSGMPAIIPVQSPVPTTYATPTTTQTSPATTYSAPNQVANIMTESEKLMSQLQAEYVQKVNNYAVQNKNVQDQMQVLSARVATVESQLNQLIQVLTRQNQPQPQAVPQAVPIPEPAQPQIESKVYYTVQAIIPGRAWLRSDGGETITVADGDLIKGLGKVTKIDPYDGVVEINTGTKVISLSYGNGSNS